MFSLPTFPKLFLLAVVIAVVWYFFRRTQVSKRDAGKSPRGEQGGSTGAKPIEDMVQCRSCGAYFPADSRCSCGKA